MKTSPIEQKLEYAQKQYEFEIERRDKLHSALALPLGVATLSGSIFTTITDLKSTEFYIMLVISAVAVIWTILAAFLVYTVAQFLFSKSYEYVAECDQVIAHLDELEKHYTAYPNIDGSDASASFLVGDLAKCATHNCRNNDFKSGRIYSVNRISFAMIVSAFLVGAIQFIDRNYVKAQSVAMTEKSTTPASSPAPPPPPPPPPTRSVKDGAHTTPPKTK